MNSLYGQRKRRQQHGFTITEALVAFLILNVGLMALMRMQSSLHAGLDATRQRSEALTVAQQALEHIRLRGMLPTGPNPQYSLSHTSIEAAASSFKHVRVAVAWQDRLGVEQSQLLSSVVSGMDPSLSGSASLPGKMPRAGGIQGRHAVIPQGAHSIGGGLSVYKPQSNGTTVWVFNNRTGKIAGICVVPPALPTDQIVRNEMTECMQNKDALLLSGYVRFAGDTTFSREEATNPSGMIKDLQVQINRDTVPSEQNACFVQGHRESEHTSYLTYQCALAGTTSHPGAWSGRILFSPLGNWTIGTDKQSFRICRYSADYNGDGRITNIENPLDHINVQTSLSQQNFIVIRGDNSCTTTPDPGLNTHQNGSTLEQQPHAQSN